MSDWNVYTVGSIDFIYNVFNATAMMMNAGTYNSMFHIAALLGVIGVVVASAISGGKTLSLGQMAVCLVMYMCFFQIPARVNIEDLTTGQYKAVDNVPFGLAAPASIISTLGESVTKTMEQAFSTPSMTTYGLVDPLFTLSSYYDALKDPMRWAISSDGIASDLNASVQSYINTCVLNDIARGNRTYSSIWRTSQGYNALKSSDQSTYVVIYDTQGVNPPESTVSSTIVGASQYTCASAYDKLFAQSSTQTPTMYTAVKRALTLSGHCGSGSSCTAQTKLADMMNFYGTSGTDARTFQLYMLTLPFLADIPKQSLLYSFQGQAAVTRAQTQTQQAFQWASSGSSFLYWMSSFMPIFQGLIYALAPFMAFLLGLGIFGTRMIGKYFLIIIWTQTWVPLAAIVNMFVLTKMKSDVTAIYYTSTNMLSFSQLYDLLMATQKNIGLAGNLLGLIPALGGFIVWGSSVAFNSLANSAAAPSPADTKTLAPDVVNAPAIMSRNSETTWSPTSGTTMTGASAIVGGLSMGSMAQSSVSSAKSELDSATAQEQAARNKAVAAIASNTQNGVHSQAMNQAVETSLREHLGSDYQNVVDFKNQTGGDDTDYLIANTSTGYQVGGDASAGISGEGGAKIPGGSGASAKASAGVSASATGTSSSTDSHGSKITSGESGGRGESANLSDGKSSDLSQKLGSVVNDVMSQSSQLGISSTTGSSYTEAYSHLQTASRQYAETEAFSQSSAVNQTIGFDAIGQKVNSAPGLDQKITQIGNGIEGFAQKRQQYANQFMSNGMNSDNAYAAAAVVALKDSGQLHQISGDLGFIAGAGAPEVNKTAASRYSGTSGDAANAAQSVRNISSETSSGVSSSESQAHGGVASSSSITSPSSVRSKVNSEYEQNSGLGGPVHAHDNYYSGSVEYQQSRSAMAHTGGYQPDNVARDSLKIVNGLASQLSNNNPTFEQFSKPAQAVATENGNSNGAHALAEYYAAGKAGVSGDNLQQFKDNAMAQIMADTGGHRHEDGSVTGGNSDYAGRAVAAVESTFERHSSQDLNILNTATKGLWAAKNEMKSSVQASGDND